MAAELITRLEQDTVEIDAVAHALAITAREAKQARQEPASIRQRQLINELTGKYDALAPHIGWKTIDESDQNNAGEAVHVLRAYRATPQPSRFAAAATIRRLIDAIETMRRTERQEGRSWPPQ